MENFRFNKSYSFHRCNKPMLFLKFIALFICSFYSFGSQAQSSKNIEIDQIVAEPGTKVSDNLIIEAGVDEATSIPITIVNGSNPGPVFTLIAGIHGTEYAPVIALQKLIYQIEPEKLNGTIILVHIANLHSFHKRTIYFNPVDDKNLNRVFPGKKDGTVTERIAFKITHEIIDQSDYLIDMHGGEFHQCCLNYAYLYYNCPDIDLCSASNKLTEAFGFDFLIPEDYYFVADTLEPMYCELTALRRGVPAIGIEIGSRGVVSLEDLKFAIQGIFNVLCALNMMEGEFEGNKHPVILTDYKIIKSNYDGIFYSLVDCGQSVAKGTLLGYTTDYFGNLIEEFYSPFTGVIIWSNMSPPVNKGDSPFWIAKAAEKSE